MHRAGMADARETVERYKQAFGSGDIGAARSLLADEFHFAGPFEEFDNPDDYLQSLAKLAPIVTGIDVKKMLVDGDDVVTIYDLQTNTPAGTSAVAEWATVRDGKIAELRAYFDARPFAGMFEG
jgi:ketosteroid isomerase-like protein